MKIARPLSLNARAYKIINLRATQSQKLLLASLLFMVLLYLLLLSSARTLPPTYNSAEPPPPTENLSTVSVKNSDLAEHSPVDNYAASIDAFGEVVSAGSDKAWVLNYKGELLFTRNGGESWSQIGGSLPNNFDSFTIVDGHRGWAVDNEGKVLKTDDRGRTWYSTGRLQPKNPSDYQYMGALQILFTDESNGWIVDTFAVWRTQDGGASWSEDEALSYSKLNRIIRKMHFSDSRLGWLICEGLVLQTKDGGKTWRSVADTLSFDITNTINAVHFLDESRGWISVSDAPEAFPENVVLFTENGGQTWSQQDNLSGQISIRNIFFLDKKTGWMVGSQRLADSKTESGVVFQTKDGGRTWQSSKTVAGNDVIKSVRFTSTEEGWMTTDNKVYRTRDGGKTWSAVLSSPEVKNRNMQLQGFDESE